MRKSEKIVNAERSLRRDGWAIRRVGEWEREASRSGFQSFLFGPDDWEEKRDTAILAVSPLPCCGGPKPCWFFGEPAHWEGEYLYSPSKGAIHMPTAGLRVHRNRDTWDVIEKA